MSQVHRKKFETLLQRYQETVAALTHTETVERLGITRTAFADFRLGKRRLPDRALALIAEVTQTDLLQVIALAHLSLPRATKYECEFWERRLRE